MDWQSCEEIEANSKGEKVVGVWGKEGSKQRNPPLLLTEERLKGSKRGRKGARAVRRYTKKNMKEKIQIRKEKEKDKW